MRVHEIWRYPVKSMIGGRVDHADLTPLGVRGDRQWALRDVEGGFVANTRQTPGIMQLAAAATDDGGAVITLLDGSTTSTAAGDVDARLCAALGRRVALAKLPPADDRDAYRRAGQMPDDLMGYLRDIFAREADEPLPDFAKFGPFVGEYDTPPGAFYDCFPLMVMTTSALAALADALPDSVIDVRRFRPSLVVDTGDQPGHPEFGWAGRRFRLGQAEIEVVNDCPRCASITKQIDADVPQDRAILRHVVRDLGQAVGVYCNVVTPGAVRVGDEFVAC